MFNLQYLQIIVWGGVFYHDAGRQFTSPTINLSFDGPDFIRFLQNPKWYLDHDIEFIRKKETSFPVGKIDDIIVNFVHYKTEEDAVQAWKTRGSRIVWDNIFVVATDHDGMYLPEMLELFDKLPYKNKVLFSAKSYPQYDWIVQVPQFKHRNNVRVMVSYANMRGQRYYETCFDIAAWIHDNSIGSCR